MKQNKEIFEKYADKLLSAMKREGLMNKEVAEIFHIPPSYMTPMSKRPEKVPERFMEMIRTWAILDKPLRGYQPSEIEMPEVTPEAARDRAEMKFRSKLAVKGLLIKHGKEVAESVNTEQTPATPFGEVSTTVKQEIAADLRKGYEAVQPQNEIIITAHKNGKVDVSKLDPRTGQVAAAELEFGDDGTLRLTYKFKP